MLRSLHNWFKQRRKAAQDVEYRRGYDYAAGALLSGENLEKIEALCYGSDDIFDKGIQHAINDWMQNKDQSNSQENLNG